MNPVPAWATSMIANYRAACKVPDIITDEQIFRLLEDLRGCDLADIEDAIREELGAA